MLHVPYKVFAAATTQKMNLDLVVDTKTLKFQDANNNKKPDSGEFAFILGKLYTPATKNEIGTYRCTFAWGGWANSTEGTPVQIATQVYDMKGNGMIVVVGDEPGVLGAEGKPVAAAISGGTGQFKGITGIATLTEKAMEGTNVPVDVVFDIMRP
jgi:hypothetical protein